jgi:hypothetical protein
VGELAAAAGVKLNIKGLRHFTASQLLAARFDLRNTAAALAMAAVEPPRSGTTPTLYRRLTGEPPPTSHN